MLHRAMRIDEKFAGSVERGIVAHHEKGDPLVSPLLPGVDRVQRPDHAAVSVPAAYTISAQPRTASY
jgi:hypothetical protein